ncbi:hypothetical protein [Streptomyces sp. NPDC059708]|uniref:hypothetical protein n=1 Tax=Streptomyces sp. NPDC059708 TaxID=3346916 RepID=UPI00369C490F
MTTPSSVTARHHGRPCHDHPAPAPRGQQNTELPLLPDDAKLALVPAEGQPGDMGADLVIEIEGGGVVVVIEGGGTDAEQITDLTARLRRAEPDAGGGGQEPA